MRFELTTIAPAGTVERIHFQAPDQSTAVRQLEVRGHTVLSVRASRSFGVAWPGSERFPVSLFSQELRVLLTAGLPLVEALDTLAQKERSDGSRAVLERLSAVLREGLTLSTAMQEFPHVFSPLYVAMVRTSERTSDLSSALERYVAYDAQLEAIRKRVANASIYPLLLVAVGGLVSLFLLLYVVPRFAHIYAERGGDLPLFSRLLLNFGQAMNAHGALAVAAFIALVSATVFLGRRYRTQLADAFWRLPAIGERLKVYQLARFYRTVGMLLRGGMPLVPALDMGGELLHPLLRIRLVAASRAISEGNGVSKSMDASGLTTPVALRMLAVGEKSGDMGAMLEHIAGFHDEELARWVDWFTRLFEPILMALIGLAVGIIVILMYMPIFELAGNLR
jgi:general secretion pathway protein F